MQYELIYECAHMKLLRILQSKIQWFVETYYLPDTVNVRQGAPRCPCRQRGCRREAEHERIPRVRNVEETQRLRQYMIARRDGELRKEVHSSVRRIRNKTNQDGDLKHVQSEL